LADGSRLPRETGKTAKELVDALKNRPGLIMMSKLPDKTALYPRAQGSMYMQTAQDKDEEQILQELMQTLGTDRVRQCLQAREEYIAEAEEWEQNFD
jgi:hypothetical protein